jgi:hypothetical protein
MKTYTLKQIETALSNKGFCPFRSYGGGITSWIYEHENGHTKFFANVDEDLLTIDGMHPTQWYELIKSEL